MLFWKMQGAGNDFILFNNLDGRYVDYSQLAKKLCDRHFGIGADGMMACEKSTSCDMRALSTIIKMVVKQICVAME